MRRSCERIFSRHHSRSGRSRTGDRDGGRECPKESKHTFISELLDTAPPTNIIKARQPGWKRAPGDEGKGDSFPFDAYVTPGQIIGPGRARYRWPSVPANSPHLGQSHGRLEEWQSSVGKLAEQSNYLAFTIMSALAGTLLPFAGPPEDPVFNLVGLSGHLTRESQIGPPRAPRLAQAQVP
jgi:hypothetical protein